MKEPRALCDLALLLDVDGTLLDVAPTPHAVAVPPQLPQLLAKLAELCDGALALISGRDLRDIDRLFAPFRFSGAGAHGCELRIDGADAAKAVVDLRLLEALHDGCRALPDLCPGVLVEYKRFGAALHYRLVPQAEPIVAAHAQLLLRRAGAGFELQPGKCVYEIKPAGFSKGTAIRELMTTAPFATRRPIFIGDDVTDEHGFQAVNRAGGISIKVGLDRASAAQGRIAGPADVHRLLAHLADHSAPARTGGPDWFKSLLEDRLTQSPLGARAPSHVLE